LLRNHLFPRPIVGEGQGEGELLEKFSPSTPPSPIKGEGVHLVERPFLNFPRPIVGEGQGEGAFSLSHGVVIWNTAWRSILETPGLKIVNYLKAPSPAHGATPPRRGIYYLFPPFHSILSWKPIGGLDKSSPYKNQLLLY